MKAWELALRVRRAACEGRLGFARERHSDIVIERNRSQPGGEAWKKKSDKLALLRWQIKRELDEIEFIKKLANVGPIVGNKMVLHVRDGSTHKVRPGPSIIDIMMREADRYDKMGSVPVQTNTEVGQTFDARSVAEGLAEALRILSNPYLYLDRDEKVAYDRAEADSNKIIERRAGETHPSEMILPGTNTAATLAKIKSSEGGGIVVRRRKNE